MSHSARSREKRRRKEALKKRQARRRQAGGPFRLIARSGTIQSCLVNADWRETGEASIYMLCRAPGQPDTVISFLIDLLCLGLKDAFGRIGCAWNVLMDKAADSGLDLVEMDVEQARRLVAGSVRHSQENNFALPRRWQRWTAILGLTQEDIDRADLSDFAPGGKLVYCGSRTDLRNRLIDCTVEEFLARPNVEVGWTNGPVLDDEEELDFDERVSEATQATLNKIRQWCFANGEQPHPFLADAMEIMAEAMIQTAPVDPDSPEARENHEQTQAKVDAMLAMESRARQVQLQAALDQLVRFANTFQSIDEYLAFLGFGGEDDEDELDDDELDEVGQDDEQAG